MPDLKITDLTSYVSPIDSDVIPIVDVTTGVTKKVRKDDLLSGSGVSDTVYGPSWNGVTTIAPSKNSVYDKIELLDAAKVNSDGSTPMTGNLDLDGNNIVNANLVKVADGGGLYNTTLNAIINLSAAGEITLTGTGLTASTILHLDSSKNIVSLANGAGVLTNDGSGGLSWGAGGGGSTFADDVFRVQDNGDATKQIAFEASGITTGTTRTLTVPDKDIEIAGIDNETFTGTTNFNNVEVGGNLTIAESSYLYFGTSGAEGIWYDGFDFVVSAATNLYLTATDIYLNGSVFTATALVTDLTACNLTLTDTNLTGTGTDLRACQLSSGSGLRLRKGGTSYNVDLEFSGVSAARTFTFPDATGTIPLLSLAQTFTAKQTFTTAATEMLSVSLLDTTYKAALSLASDNLMVGAGATSVSILNSTFTISGAGQKTLTHGGLTLTASLSSPGVTFNNPFTGSSSGDIYSLRVTGSFQKAVTANYFGLTIINTINQLTGAVGDVTFLNISPTITSVLTGNSIYGFRSQLSSTVTGGGTAWNIYADGTAGNFFGGFVNFDSWVKKKSYTVAGVPSASTAGAGAEIYVSNESGGAVPAFSDGTDWRRVTDRAIIT